MTIEEYRRNFHIIHDYDRVQKSDQYHDEFLGARARRKQELGVVAEKSGYIELTRKEIDWFL